MISAGFLRSTGVSRFIATMNPSDSLESRRAVMRSRAALACPRAREVDRSRGSLRFLVDLSAPAVPNHPGEFVPLRLLVASRTMAGFPFSERLATLAWRNEAESGSLALRLTPSRTTGFDDRVAPSRRCRHFTVNEQFPCSVPFN
jgi:hypothetical protein